MHSQLHKSIDTLDHAAAGARARGEGAADQPRCAAACQGNLPHRNLGRGSAGAVGGGRNHLPVGAARPVQ